MKQADIIIEELKRVCGLDVVCANDALATETEIYTDTESGRTYFAVPSGGKTLTFAFDGAGDAAHITAALAREYALGVISKFSSEDEPLRAFLEGERDVPPNIKIGKSDYYVFAVYAENGSVRDYLAAMATGGDLIAGTDEYTTAFCKILENDSDYQSAGEFAAVLRENLTEEIKCDVKIGVGGTARGVSELPRCFAHAKSALALGAEFDPQNGIYSYKEYALVKVLSDLAEQSPASLQRFLATTLDKSYAEVLGDPELMSAADAFIKHSLNISEASRSMYVHRNTLIYRLDKIEKMTGLNIRSFNDAMAFRVAYLVSKLL